MAKKPTNPKDLVGQAKAPLHLVPGVSIIHQAEAMRDGAEKYGPYNWRKNDVQASVYAAAALRHIILWYDGEDVAKDSKVNHLGHGLACLGIILDAIASGCLIDDRPMAGKTMEVMEEAKERQVARTKAKSRKKARRRAKK